MSHVFRVPDELYSEIASYAEQRGQTPDSLLIELVQEGMEQIKQTDSMAAIPKVAYDPARDPLAPFIGALDSGIGNSDWIERHDDYFVGSWGNGVQHGDKE